MRRSVNYKKIYGILFRIKLNDFDYSVAELESVGLRRICVENNVDYDELNQAEKEVLSKELIAMAEEVEFNRYYRDLFEESD